jgi:putative hemolysin
MDLIPRDKIDAKAALKAMPPLIKAYMRLGAFVGDGAVIDHQFGTTDVLIILPVEKIDPRYFEHFGAPDEVKSRIALDA